MVKNIHFFIIFVIVSILLLFSFSNIYQIKQCKKNSSYDELKLYAESLKQRLKESTKRLNRLERTYNKIAKNFNRYRGFSYLVSHELLDISNEAETEAINEARYHEIYMGEEDQMEEFLLGESNNIEEILDFWIKDNEKSSNEVEGEEFVDDLLSFEISRVEKLNVDKEKLLMLYNKTHSYNQKENKNFDFNEIFNEEEEDLKRINDLQALQELEEEIAMSLTLEQTRVYCNKLFTDFNVSHDEKVENFPLEMQTRYILFSCDAIL